MSSCSAEITLKAGSRAAEPAADRPEKLAVQLRQAEKEDIHAIWELLHAESVGMDPRRIARQLQHLFVLVFGKRVIGVLYGSFLNPAANIQWCVIHPYFPEKTLQLGITQIIKGVLGKK